MFRTLDLLLIAVMVLAAAFTYKTKHDAERQYAELRLGRRDGWNKRACGGATFWCIGREEMGYMDTWIHGYMDTWIHGCMDT